MTANTKTNTIAKDSSNAAVDSVAKITIITMGAASGLIGLWAVSCIVSAMVSTGPVGLVRGFISAVTGM